MVNLTKRHFLKQGLHGLRACGAGALCSNLLLACSYLPEEPQARALQAADSNGVRLPAGFRSRIIARSGQPVVDRDFSWHAAPDGGACFATADGGWIYVSNSEMWHSGGVGAIVFDATGAVIDAYPILSGTDRNCAGGATPWGSWLSCEEVKKGLVWECYPDGQTPAEPRPALGAFMHEAVAVDEDDGLLYLTEDRRKGCLYRFRAARSNAQGYPDLDSGSLQVAVAVQGSLQSLRAGDPASSIELDWIAVPDPLAQNQATRRQLTSALHFDGGEGIAWFDGRVVFVTKGDNRVWSYDVASQHLRILYDAQDSLTPILTGVDNVTVSQAGDIYVAEDGGDLQIVVLDSHGRLYPVAQLQGHDRSEIAGLAFSPDGRRLYFSSQRGTSGRSEDGITFEIRGF